LGQKKIYLIRHGETDYNLKGIIQGSGVDTNLNDTGRKQALAFYETYRHIPFSKVYTSALKRTFESVEHFIKMGVPHEAYAGLNEISWGEKDGKIATGKDHQFYLEMLECWRRGEAEKCIAGGESPLDVQKRQKPVIDLILSRKDENPVLVCMHGRAMRILLATLMENSLKNMDQFEHNNLGLYIIQIDGGKISLEKTNDTEHLRI
jgi:broad specificity phosphatase PhoE